MRKCDTWPGSNFQPLDLQSAMFLTALVSPADKKLNDQNGAIKVPNGKLTFLGDLFSLHLQN